MKRFFISVWLMAFYLGCFSVVVPIFLKQNGFNERQIGLFFTTSHLFVIFFLPFSGHLINHLGIKNSLLFSFAIAATTSLVFKSCSMTFVFILCIGLIQGLSEGFFHIGQDAMLNVRKESGKLISRILGGKVSIRGIGGIVGGLLIQELLFPNIFLSFAILTTTLLLLILSLKKKEFTPKKKKVKEAKIAPRLYYLVGLSRLIFQTARFLSMRVGIILYLYDTFKIDPFLVGLIAGGGRILQGICEFILGRRTETGNKLQMLFEGRVIQFIFFFLLFRMTNVSWFIPFFLILSFISGYENVTNKVFKIDEGQTTVNLGYYQTLEKIGKPLGLLIFSLIARPYGIRYCFLISGFLIFLSCTLVYFVKKRVSKP